MRPSSVGQHRRYVARAFQYSPAVAQVADSQTLLAEADRLAWLRVSTRAEPLYSKAREALITAGDERNALYAEVNRLRGQLPKLAVPEVSERLSEYLDHPLVRDDERLRKLPRQADG